MLSEKMQSALNGQINAEIFSGYLYLSMGAYLAERGLKGFTHWMQKQDAEERSHAAKIYDYVADNGRVWLEAIEAPPAKWDSPLAIAQHVLDHERKVTGLIEDLVELAREEGDQETVDFLQWFIKEQEEEEESAGSLLEKVRSAGESEEAMAGLDEELGQR